MSGSGAEASASLPAVLEALMREDGLSRADVSRRSGLSKPTVSRCVAQLIEWKLLMETGPGDNPLGKKATLLSFNRRWAFVAGVDIGNFMIRAGLFDLSGQQAGFTATRLRDVSDGPVIFDIVERDLRVLMEKAGLCPGDVAAIVIGVPGVRDSRRGLNRLAPFMTRWEDEDLTRGLAARICPRVLADNNVNLGMMGEHWQGNARGVQNAVYLEFGIGVGAGLLVDGRVATGSAGAAGEIAYASLGSGPPRNRFENLGALEEQLSSRSLLSRYAAAGGSSLPDDPAEALTGLFDRYDAGQAAAAEVVEPALALAGRLFVSLAAILNPEALIVGGGMGPLLLRYARRFEEELSRCVPYPPALRPAGCGSAAVVIGAARRALNGLDASGLLELAQNRDIQ